MKNTKSFEDEFKVMTDKLVASGYMLDHVIAKKVWTLNDLLSRMESLKILPTESLIAELLNKRYNTLEDCTDEEWNSIDAEILEMKSDIEKKEEIK